MSSLSSQRADILPLSLPPLGINREQAAALIGVSATTFDKSVAAGIMPHPRILGGRSLWDVAELTAAFRRLPHKDDGVDLNATDATTQRENPWDAAKIQ
jgi:predicted DNA-binding transcriptional regulator AlpA